MTIQKSKPSNTLQSQRREILSKIENLYIEQGSEGYILTKRLLNSELNSSHKIHIVGAQQINELQFSILSQRDAYETGKKNILIRSSKGGFFNQCPGTKGLLCCNYYIINPIIGCNFDCSYCFLQGYLDSPLIHVVANLEEHLQELGDWLRQRPLSFFRIGTGELGDSLSLDPILGIGEILISFFRDYENVQLELKSKSDYIDHLLPLQHDDNIIISFSLNPQSIIDSYEHGTASLKKRLAAANKLSKFGYRLAFHFDPIFYYPNWQKDYQKVVDQLFSSINSNLIQYISLGVLRYFDKLKDEVYRRFPQSNIFSGPYVPGEDGKWRYQKKVRESIFVAMKEMILAKDPKQWIYFCMEGKSTWQNVFNLDVESKRNLDSYFRARRQGNSKPLLK